MVTSDERRHLVCVCACVCVACHADSETHDPVTRVMSLQTDKSIKLRKLREHSTARGQWCASESKRARFSREQHSTQGSVRCYSKRWEHVRPTKTTKRESDLGYNRRDAEENKVIGCFCPSLLLGETCYSVSRWSKFGRGLARCVCW